jgi:CRISPR system Cascade subunit CasB
MSLQFKPETDAGKVLHNWWSELEENKGDRAALRRCGESVAVVFVPAYHDLYEELKRCGQTNESRLPAVAGLLAHVKSLLPGRILAEQMANPKGPGSTAPTVSELRFRRLLQCQTPEELFPALRRVVSLLNEQVNIYSLADSVYWWGDAMRRRWAYAYYGALKH